MDSSKRHSLSPRHPWPRPRVPRHAQAPLRPANDTDLEPVDQLEPGPLSGTRDLRLSPSEERLAEELLAERYARGEIDEEEYRRRLEVLRTSTLTRP